MTHAESITPEEGGSNTKMKLCKDCKFFSIEQMLFNFNANCTHDVKEVDDMVFGGIKSIGLKDVEYQRDYRCKGDWWEAKA